MAKAPTEYAETRMYHVKGNTTWNTKAVETSAHSSKLNSNDCFVIIQSTQSIVWAGKGSNGDEREMARNIAKKLSSYKNISVIAEGHESTGFWNILGGKTEYPSLIDSSEYDELTDYQGRLFECSNASGKFTVEEIYNFDQSDLDPTDVMLLDAWEVIFMWIGKEANADEKLRSVQAASDYLSTHPADRNPKTSLITVKQGYEPFNFTGWFQAWDPEFWGPVEWDPYVTKGGDQAKQGGDEINLDPLNISKQKGMIENRGDNVVDFIEYKILKESAVEDLPPRVDITKKENYLSNEEFRTVFHMSKTEFSKLKNWKQEQLKKEVGLF